MVIAKYKNVINIYTLKHLRNINEHLLYYKYLNIHYVIDFECCSLLASIKVCPRLMGLFHSLLPKHNVMNVKDGLHEFKKIKKNNF